MELEECIKDAIDESMKEYICSDEYITQQQEISELQKALKERLSEKQQNTLNQLLDRISTCDGQLAAEAYMHGVVEGIALRGKITDDRQ